VTDPAADAERLRRRNRRSTDLVLVLAVVGAVGLTGLWVCKPAETERDLACFGYMLTDPDAHRRLCQLPPTGVAAEIAKSAAESTGRPAGGGADRAAPWPWFRPNG
jgi:hypothetical protein